MKQNTKNVLFWSPRVLCILFALFISIFALDVFDNQYSFWQTVLALVIHLIPTAVIVLVLVISWKWEWVGGVVFIVLPVLYVLWVWGRFPFSVYLIMCGPMLIISFLFFINWKYRAELKTK